MASIMPSRRTLVAALTALVAGGLPNRASARTNAYCQRDTREWGSESI